MFAPLFVEPEHGFLIGHGESGRIMWYGLLLGFFALGQFFGSPFLGAWSDRVGRKNVLLFTILINVFAYLLFAYGIYIKSLWILFVSRTIAGLLGSSLPVMQSAIADVSSEEDKAKNFGIVGIALGTGFIIGALLGGTLSDASLVEWFNFSLPFLFVSALSFANFFFVLNNFPSTLSVLNKSKLTYLKAVQNINRAFTSPKLKLMFLSIYFMTLGFSFFLQYLPVNLEIKFGYEQSGIALAVAYLGIWVAITQGLILPWISKAVNPWKLLVYTIPLFAFSYLLLLIPQEDDLLFYVFLPLLIIFQSVTYPNTLAILSNVSEKSIQGEIIGINQSVHALSGILPPLVGWIFVKENPDSPMLAGCIFAFVGWIVYLMHYKKSQYD